MMPVVHVAADLGQGGTERSIELLATAAAGPRDQRVIGLDRDGPTGERLRAAGIRVDVFAGDYAAAARAIETSGAGAALLNRSGRPEAKWSGIIRRLAQGSVMPLEISHFGWLDRDSIAAGLKGSFAVSGTTLAKYLRQMFGHWPSEAEIASAPLALAAGNNPVAPIALQAGTRAEMRLALGLPADDFIAVRIGRPDPRKWSDLIILHGARLAAELPRLHFLFLSAPASRVPLIQHLFGERATIAPFTSDRSVVARYLAASDAMLHYARYGESFGYALAEAALAGLPVVAQLTPWGDNAQAELIRSGETGFLVEDYDSARRALAKLMAEPAFARELAKAAALDIARRFGVVATWRLLDAFIAHARGGGRGLIAKPVDLAADQRARLAAGISSYGMRHPLLRRMAVERPLYLRPWFWRFSLEDAAAILKRRLLK
jgi:glycosyl transferase family 1